MKLKAIIVACAAASLSACATDAYKITQEEYDAHDFGPMPNKEMMKRVAEPFIRDLMKDPDSTRFTWNNPIRQGYYGGFMQKPTLGYYTCGLVNAKNSFGGYTGNSPFIVVWDKGEIVNFDMDEDVGGYVTQQCRKEFGGL